MVGRITKFIRELFEKQHSIFYLFLPFAYIYQLGFSIRRLGYQYGWLKSYRAPVPVLVVGNITLGGVGKTPLVIALANALIEQNIKVAVVSRGYKSQASVYPFEVFPNSHSINSGDEPLMIRRNINAPVVIDAKRPRAIQYLLAQHPEIDLIISDDGLQHFAMQRDIEIAVIGDWQKLIHERIFPAGHLREPLSRLDKVDFIVNFESSENILAIKQKFPGKFFPLQLCQEKFIHLRTGAVMPVAEFITKQDKKPIHAVCGIGNPNRFLKKLKQLGLNIMIHIFPDHHFFSKQDLLFKDDYAIVMTEKDAVKCDRVELHNAWYLENTAKLPVEWLEQLLWLVHSAILKKKRNRTSL